jgi:putative membrane protein
MLIMMATKDNNFENSREHLANERTFLAWVRTGIALMGFGFVIVKFSLFLEQLSLTFQTTNITSREYGEIFGIVMIAMGLLFTLLAFIQYKNNEKKLNSKHYIPSSRLYLFLTLIMLTGGAFLILYLLISL